MTKRRAVLWLILFLVLVDAGASAYLWVLWPQRLEGAPGLSLAAHRRATRPKGLPGVAHHAVSTP